MALWFWFEPGTRQAASRQRFRDRSWPDSNTCQLRHQVGNRHVGRERVAANASQGRKELLPVEIVVWRDGLPVRGHSGRSVSGTTEAPGNPAPRGRSKPLRPGRPRSVLVPAAPGCGDCAGRPAGSWPNVRPQWRPDFPGSPVYRWYKTCQTLDKNYATWFMVPMRARKGVEATYELSIGGAATGGASQREAPHLLRELVHGPNSRPEYGGVSLPMNRALVGQSSWLPVLRASLPAELGHRDATRTGRPEACPTCLSEVHGPMRVQILEVPPYP